MLILALLAFFWLFYLITNDNATYTWVIKQNKKYKKMPLALNVIPKKVLCSAEKSSVIWAEPHSRSSAKQFCRTEGSFGH